MKRSAFIKYLLPSAWALQACVKEEVEKPKPITEIEIKANLDFPTTTDFLISGVLNPIRFSAVPAQEVEVRLMNLNQDTILASARSSNEVWLQIPQTKIQTKYILIVHKTVFEVTSNPTNGEAVSLKQYETELTKGKTISIVNTDDIPFALKQNEDKTFTALDMNCTHNGCPIELKLSNHFECKCHGSKFDADGMVTLGPALDNLRTFTWQYFSTHNVVVVQNR